MKIEYDSTLIDDVVFLEVQRREAEGNLELLRKYRRRLDPLYEELPPAERDKGFASAHFHFFAQLGFEKLLPEIVAEYPCLIEAVHLTVVRKATSHVDEGAELFVRREHRSGPQQMNTVVVKVRPQRFVGRASLGPFLRHELMHVSDMVDGEFGYDPGFRLPGRTQAEENLLKDRYQILWDITIDGRITRAGKEPLVAKSEWEQTFYRLFPSKSSMEFEEIWSVTGPTHGLLIGIAGSKFMREAARGRVGGEKMPGSPCPLCGFPTHDWAGRDMELLAETEELIREDFPTWTPESGVCGHCFELYQSKVPVASS